MAPCEQFVRGQSWVPGSKETCRSPFTLLQSGNCRKALHLQICFIPRKHFLVIHIAEKLLTCC